MQDAAGTISFLLDFGDPITTPLSAGALVTLKLYLDEVRFYLAPAIIDQIEFAEIDIDGGKTIGGTAWFSAAGAVTKPDFS